MDTLKKCFFITPMGKKDSESDLRSKQIIKNLNQLFAKNDVFIKIQRTDQYNQTGVMTDNIHNQIKESDLVITDLTRNNPNVAYELGYANAFNKPIIQICSTDAFQLSSDWRHIYTLDYSLENECANFQFEQELLGVIKGINFDPNYTPVTPTLGFVSIGDTDD